MKRDAPAWAFQVLQVECQRAGVPVPSLLWRRAPGVTVQTSGSTNLDRGIRMNVGSDTKYAKMVLLHEISHWIRNTRGGERFSHDSEFWNIAFGLYRRYRMGLYALEHEQSYKIGAIHAAQRAGLITRADAKERNAKMTARYMEAARSTRQWIRRHAHPAGQPCDGGCSWEVVTKNGGLHTLRDVP